MCPQAEQPVQQPCLRPPHRIQIARVIVSARPLARESADAPVSRTKKSSRQFDYNAECKAGVRTLPETDARHERSDGGHRKVSRSPVCGGNATPGKNPQTRYRPTTGYSRLTLASNHACRPFSTANRRRDIPLTRPAEKRSRGPDRSRRRRGIVRRRWQAV